MPAPPNGVIPLEPVTQRFPPASPWESISTELAVTKDATRQSGGKAGAILILLLVVLLGIAVIFIALEVYRLRVQSRCLLQSHNMQVLDQIVNELPRDINESVNKQLHNHKEHAFNVMEQQLAQYHHQQTTMQPTPAMVSPIFCTPAEIVQVPESPRDAGVPVRSPVKGGYQPLLATAPVSLLETLPFETAQMNERPGIVIEEVGDEEVGDEEACVIDADLSQKDADAVSSPEVRGEIVVPPAYDPCVAVESRSETSEIESDLEDEDCTEGQ